jgi:uncharacterized protein (UPF0305 family)
MSVTFDIQPEILKKYSKKQLEKMFNIFLVQIENKKLNDDFEITEEFLDFRELSNEEVENLPEKTKWKLNNIDKLTFVE